MVTMTLTPKDFSIFDESVGNWTPVTGIFTLYMGTSSNNLPLSVEVERLELGVNIAIV